MCIFRKLERGLSVELGGNISRNLKDLHEAENVRFPGYVRPARLEAAAIFDKDIRLYWARDCPRWSEWAHRKGPLPLFESLALRNDMNMFIADIKALGEA